MSLRWRVLLTIFSINALVFGVFAAFVLRERVADAERLGRRRTADLLYTLKGTIRPGAALNVAYILQWPYWGDVEDAILVDREIHRPEFGGIRTPGIALNPVGIANRPPGFDYQDALASILRAVESGTPVEEVEGGRAVPIEGERGVWGGLWYRADVRVDRGAILRGLLPWFLLSTLLLTLGSFLVLRRIVLDPVALLAGGARRVRGGDLAVRLREPRRHDEVSDLVRSFNEMTETVHGFNSRLEREVEEATEKARQAEAAAMTQRRLAAMGELAAGIAHEINNPLGGLQNAVEVLRRGPVDEEKRERYLGLLARGLERIGETVRRLLRFTPRSAANADLDLVELVQDAIDLTAHRAERARVAVYWLPPPDPPAVHGARDEVGQAVLNLLANSLDAIEERAAGAGKGAPGLPAAPAETGGRIDVSLRREADAVVLRVRDDGPGVPADELQRVADLFYTTKDVGKGTGLGLSLVHRAMHALGGTVHLESEEGRYFQVELSFPADGGAERSVEGGR